MKLITRILLPLCLLLPITTFGETMDDLVKRDGLYYKEFTDVPFTGKTTGATQGTIRNGKREGIWVEYHDNGQLRSKGTLKDGKWDGPWVLYYENGQLWFKGTYKDGKWDGPWVQYHDNGQLRSKGTYKGGEKEDDWVYYSSDGSVVETGDN